MPSRSEIHELSGAPYERAGSRVTKTFRTLASDARPSAPDWATMCVDPARYRSSATENLRVRSLHRRYDVLLRPHPRSPYWQFLATQLALLGVLSGGCGGGDTSVDAGPDTGVDGSVVPDVGPLPDGAVVLPDGNVVFPDAGLPDGAVVLPDGNVVFPDGGEADGGGVSDGGTEIDASVLPDLDIPDPVELPESCFDGEGQLDLCGCLTSTDCSSVACTGGTMCIDDGCGGQRCVTAGHPCVDASDCPAGGTCEDSPAGRSCRPPGPSCRDDRECPLGFACESMACVDRRVYCDTAAFACPIGYTCDQNQQFGQAFCRRVDVACHRSETCPQPGACYDLDGDGVGECVPEELMCVPELCVPDGRICGAQPEEKGYRCGFLGSCAVQGCPVPLLCTDFAGDGRPTCAPAGTCDAHSDCPAGEICATPHFEMSPRCVGSAVGGTP